jgi:hypothetical protein
LSCLRGVSTLGICELAAIASSSALLLSKEQCTEDLETLGNLVATIGSMILTFASSGVIRSKEECKKIKCKKSNEITEKIDESIEKIVMQQQIDSNFKKPNH